MTTIITHRFFVDVQIHNIVYKLIQFHLCKFYAQKKKKCINSSRVYKVSISNYILIKFCNYFFFFLNLKYLLDIKFI